MVEIERENEKTSNEFGKGVELLFFLTNGNNFIFLE
jgi:hypothetical protein